MRFRTMAAISARTLAIIVAAAGLLELGACGGGGTMPGPAATQGSSTPAIKNFFGMHIHDALHHWPSVPFSTWRLWDATVSWANVEPQKGVFDFSLLDQYVSLAQQHNVQLIYVLGNTPSWSAQNPSSPSNEGIPGASSPPTNVQDWQDFVTQVATRYKGKIQAYEVWNEADLLGYWTGSVTDMLQLAKIAYNTIKQIDPSATVLAPSLVAGNGPAWLQQYLAAGGASFTDAIPFHLYTMALAPEDALAFDKNVISIAHQAGKEVWDTEVGFGPWGTFSDPDAAAFVARTLIVQTSLGITHINWYAWDDRGPWVHLYMVQPDLQTPTLAANAFAQVESWLQTSSITCSQDQSDLSWQCPLTTADGKQEYIVWNPFTPEAFPIPSNWQVTRAVDVQGNVQTISNGQIQISGSPLLLEP